MSKYNDTWSLHHVGAIRRGPQQISNKFEMNQMWTEKESRVPGGFGTTDGLGSPLEDE